MTKIESQLREWEAADQPSGFTVANITVDASPNRHLAWLYDLEVFSKVIVEIFELINLENDLQVGDF